MARTKSMPTITRGILLSSNFCPMDFAAQDSGRRAIIRRKQPSFNASRVGGVPLLETPIDVRMLLLLPGML